jgi:predicted enzyme related to lactoylglutathione lyase
MNNKGDTGTMKPPPLSLVFFCLVAALMLGACNTCEDCVAEAQPAGGSFYYSDDLHIHYLEVVTPNVDATCRTLEQIRRVQFGVPIAELGNARTAGLHFGGMIGVRAPMHDGEEPTVRPYILVNDIEAALKSAVAAGGEVAHPPLEIPGRGKFAIYCLGGIQHGLWQL